MKKNKKSETLAVLYVKSFVSLKDIIKEYKKVIDSIDMEKNSVIDNKYVGLSNEFRVFYNKKWRMISYDCMYLKQVSKKQILWFFKKYLTESRIMYGTISEFKITIQLNKSSVMVEEMK